MREDNPKMLYRGRLAPTPSGFLHSGHIRTFRTAWERTKANNGKMIFRMDDLDPKRCEKKYVDACIEDIKLMGLDWDEGPDLGGGFGPYEQSNRSDLYLETLGELFELGLIYPCEKSRKDVRAARLMDSLNREFLFPKDYRPSCIKIKKQTFPGKTNWRFRTSWGDAVKFMDIKKAEQSFTIGTDLSDFLVWRKDGVASYDLATVVDDYYMKITEVVRGEDLLFSTARQCLLFDALGWERPSFYHCELKLGADGKKLSKSAHRLPRLFSTI